MLPGLQVKRDELDCIVSHLLGKEHLEIGLDQGGGRVGIQHGLQVKGDELDCLVPHCLDKVHLKVGLGQGGGRVGIQHGENEKSVPLVAVCNCFGLNLGWESQST